MKFKYFQNSIFLFVLFISFLLRANLLPVKNKVSVDYSICPKSPASDFVFKTSEFFEENGKSLKKLKQHISDKMYKRKYFLSDYKINYNPIKKTLMYFLNCSKPILKLSSLNKDGRSAYDIILTKDGATHDPSYLAYAKADGLIKEVPRVSLPSEMVTDKNKRELVLLTRNVNNQKNIPLREIIYSSKKDLVMLIGEKDEIISVFLGESFWPEKIKKLEKIMSYMVDKKKRPSQINIVDIEKIVIKF